MSEPTASQCLRDGVDDLYKAASQFAGLGYATNARRFNEKAERLDAALERVRVAVAALEAIRDRHYCYDRGVRWACGGCEQDHPCANYEDAVRALDALTPNTPTKEQADA